MTAVVQVQVKSLVYEERLQLENIFGMLMARGMTQTYILKFALVIIVIKSHAPISEYELLTKV